MEFFRLSSRVAEYRKDKPRFPLQSTNELTRSVNLFLDQRLLFMASEIRAYFLMVLLSEFFNTAVVLKFFSGRLPLFSLIRFS